MGEPEFLHSKDRIVNSQSKHVKWRKSRSGHFDFTGKSTFYIPWVNGGSSCGWSSEVVADKAMEGTIGLCTA